MYGRTIIGTAIYHGHFSSDTPSNFKFGRRYRVLRYFRDETGTDRVSALNDKGLAENHPASLFQIMLFEQNVMAITSDPSCDGRDPGNYREEDVVEYPIRRARDASIMDEPQ